VRSLPLASPKATIKITPSKPQIELKEDTLEIYRQMDKSFSLPLNWLNSEKMNDNVLMMRSPI
jgi:hypothetical protein